MECNLRFLMLRTHLPLSDVELLTDTFHWGFRTPRNLNPYLRDRFEIIQKLRSLALGALPQPMDPDWEYFVPLFLIAFGLLRFHKQLGNQYAAERQILALATHLARLPEFQASARRNRRERN